MRARPHLLLAIVAVLAVLGAVALDVETAPAQSRDDACAIEDPHGVMSHWYRRLAAAERGGSDAVARALMYGESTNATDRVSGKLRELLQRRFGDAGKGFVPIAPGWPAQGHRHVEWDHEGRWRTWVVNRRNGPLDRYGLGGVIATNRHEGAKALFATVDDSPVGNRVSRYELFYQAWPGGGDVALRVDGGAHREISTRSDTVADRVHAIEVSDGPHLLEVEAASPSEEVRLYGVVMERDRPGVVVDGLMLVGAFTRVLLQFDQEHWARQIELRQPDLMVFWMGGNDAVSKTTGFSSSRYVDQYSTALSRARRGRPEASCLVVGVLDAAERRDGHVRTLRRIPRVVDAQRQAALGAGCAFFDLFEAAGGHGTMRRWRHTSPRYAEGDYEHLTVAGAEHVGEMLYEELMRGYQARGR